MEIEYIGEHLLPGRIGNAFIVLSFVASFFATFSYYRAIKDEASWKSLSRLFFRIHSLSVLGIAGSLFYIIFIYIHHFLFTSIIRE